MSAGKGGLVRVTWTMYGKEMHVDFCTPEGAERLAAAVRAHGWRAEVEAV